MKRLFALLLLTAICLSLFATSAFAASHVHVRLNPVYHYSSDKVILNCRNTGTWSPWTAVTYNAVSGYFEVRFSVYVNYTYVAYASCGVQKKFIPKSKVCNIVYLPNY
ncbi:MAG: hypothetical protein C4562_04350 [Actinobacteria bacterium]|nr:MAG: hypothetical protein C4562_04350 [Actinomycetota bacterium]